MNKVNNIDAEIAATALEIQRIGNLGVRKTQAKNHRLDLPNFYSRNGKLVYEMPDASINVKNKTNSSTV